MRLVRLQDLSEIGVSHNPDIKKRVLLQNGVIPHLTTFAQAVFKPGQSVEMHKHDTMFEIFFIQSGKADFVVGGKKVTLMEGHCLTVEPKEMHSQSNPYDQDAVWLYFGIATE